MYTYKINEFLDKPIFKPIYKLYFTSMKRKNNFDVL